MAKAKVKAESKEIKPEVEKRSKKNVSEKPVEEKKKKPLDEPKKVVAEVVAKKKKVVAKKTTFKDRILNVDKKGISLQPSNVKNMLLNFVFNGSSIKAESELKEHEAELLNESNLKNGYESFHKFSESTQNYIRELRQTYLNQKRVQYERRVVNSLIRENRESLPANLDKLLKDRRQLLKQSPNTSLRDLYTKYDKHFYDNFTEESVINNYAGEKAYHFYKGLINKNKIRLNEASRNRLTYFLELVLTHLISNASITCILNKKDKLNIANLSKFSKNESFHLHSIVENLNAWRNAFNQTTNNIIEEQDSETGKIKRKRLFRFIDMDRLNPNNKYKFKGQVSDIYNNVNRSFSSNPPKLEHSELNTKEITESFSTLKLSGEFNELCAQVLIELIHNIGDVLKAILRTRKDRTIDENLVNAIINTYHISFNSSDKFEETQQELNRLNKSYIKAQEILKKKRAENPGKKNNLIKKKAKV